MADYTTPVDIANRALQHVGGTRITAFTDVTRNANSVAFAYDKVRKAELRRNVWRFATRRALLRPFDTTTMNFIPGAFDVTKSYLNGSIVSYGGRIYQANTSIAASTTTPDNNSPNWTLYFGPLTVQPFDTTLKTAYYAGELVYSTSGVVYLSLTSSNSIDPTAAVPAWSATTIYNKNQTVTQAAVVYQSTIDLNLNNTPTGVAPWVTIPVTQPDSPIGQSWLKLGAATVTSIQITYPIGTGPTSQTATLNIYRLPNGFLREAPQAPKQGATSYLGAANGLQYRDWTYEGNYLVTSGNDPISYRFCADVAEVTQMDPMFIEGLACRIALETCEEITQSTEKLSAIATAYNKFMGEARTVNGIEVGPTEAPLDDYIACRI